MANFSTVFQDEVARLCKKTLKKETSTLQAQVRTLRTQVSAMRKELISHQREIAALKKQVAKRDSPLAVVAESTHRYGPKMMISFIRKHALSPTQMCVLFSASDMTVRNWVKGKRPRQRFLDRFNELKSLSKTEVQELLSA